MILSAPQRIREAIEQGSRSELNHVKLSELIKEFSQGIFTNRDMTVKIKLTFSEVIALRSIGFAVIVSTEQDSSVVYIADPKIADRWGDNFLGKLDLMGDDFMNARQILDLWVYFDNNRVAFEYIMQQIKNRHIEGFRHWEYEDGVILDRTHLFDVFRLLGYKISYGEIVIKW